MGLETLRQKPKITKNIISFILKGIVSVNDNHVSYT